MRWGSTNSGWVKWFAWRPIKINYYINIEYGERRVEGPWVWLEWVERKLWSVGFFSYYRFIDEDGTNK